MERDFVWRNTLADDSQMFGQPPIGDRERLKEEKQGEGEKHNEGNCIEIMEVTEEEGFDGVLKAGLKVKDIYNNRFGEIQEVSDYGIKANFDGTVEDIYDPSQLEVVVNKKMPRLDINVRLIKSGQKINNWIVSLEESKPFLPQLKEVLRDAKERAGV